MKINQTFFWKSFANFAKTHKQWHQWAFKTTSSNKKRNSQCKGNEIIKEDANWLFNWRSRDKTLKCDKEIDAKTALKLEFESRSLPVVPQLRFNGNANKLRFIKCSYMQVHFKFSFDNRLRMTYVINALPKGQ